MNCKPQIIWANLKCYEYTFFLSGCFDQFINARWIKYSRSSKVEMLVRGWKEGILKDRNLGVVW